MTEAIHPEDNIKSLFIIGRRWFARLYGNTYHKTYITINGQSVESEETYGYGDQYLQTAHELLHLFGSLVHVLLEKAAHAGVESHVERSQGTEGDAPDGDGAHPAAELVRDEDPHPV